jgi:aspartyl-tRNA(Asn)/glutamyl-tRNA(Gln) amidotransferase subunit A
MAERMIPRRWTIAKAAHAIASGELSPIDLLAQCLERIDRFDERVRAWEVVDREGARRAAEQSQARQRDGHLLGPLDGIPIGIKDIVDVAGLPTRAGSPITSDKPAERDAPLVAQLRNAGAVILGKTVTTQFASFDPPATRNPWNLDHTPGGSSSGSAAAVTLGMCLGAVGTQTGGSITRPAIFCGVAGMKPTFGDVSVEGIVPLSPRLDHAGPIATCVEDLRLMWEGMRAREEQCSVGGRSAKPQAGWGDGGRATLGGLKLACLQPYFIERASDRVIAGFLAAMERLRGGGAAMASVELPESFFQVREMHYSIMAVEAARQHAAQFAAHRAQYAPKITELIEDGLATEARKYEQALLHQQKFQEDMAALLAEFDAAITPATVTAAPTIDTTGDPRFNSPWSYAGLPTVSIPCGLTDEGLPVGVQLIGEAGNDDSLLEVARWCEERLAFDAVPPLLG